MIEYNRKQYKTIKNDGETIEKLWKNNGEGNKKDIWEKSRFLFLLILNSRKTIENNGETMKKNGEGIKENIWEQEYSN